MFGYLTRVGFIPGLPLSNFIEFCFLTRFNVLCALKSKSGRKVVHGGVRTSDLQLQYASTTCYTTGLVCIARGARSVQFVVDGGKPANPIYLANTNSLPKQTRLNKAKNQGPDDARLQHL